jgi:tRNA threonylcarbamoyladenosine biosynthesis protein TsaB
MITLGIDCSTKMTNVGLSQDGMALDEVNLELGRQQSAKLPVLVEQLLKENGLSFADLGLIAVAAGPGYYTGIRTGVAYAAALAEALRLKVTPLSTLELFVYDLRNIEKPLAPVLRARRSSFYGAVYTSDGENLTAVVKPLFCKPAQFTEILEKYKDAIIVGSDAELYPELIELPNERLKRLSGSGGQAAVMGEKYCDKAVPPKLLRGVYLREPDIGPTTD